MKVRILGVCLLPLLTMVACSSGDLDGPQRESFDDVRRVSIEVERGEVNLFGSDRVEGAMIDRWISGEADFATLSQRNSGGELIVDSRCNEGGYCDARFDLAVQRSTRIDARVKRGELNLYRLLGSVQVEVDEGYLGSHRLAVPHLVANLRQGRARLHFEKPPAELRLTVGDDASMDVILPPSRYHCHFDVEAPSIELGDLECHGQGGDVIRIDPPDASVRFEVVHDDL